MKNVPDTVQDHNTEREENIHATIYARLYEKKAQDTSIKVWQKRAVTT